MAQEHSGAAWIERFWHILAKKSTQEAPQEAEEAKERAKRQKKEPSRGQRGKVGGKKGLWRGFGVDLVNGNGCTGIEDDLTAGMAGGRG